MEEKFQLGSVDIYVNENHRFGTDAVLLADFASPFPSETVCDLCTGCGIIPLFFCRSKPPKKVYGVELQREAVELFGKSVRENGLEDILLPVEADLTDTKALKEIISNNGLKLKYVAEQLGLSRYGFSLKVENKKEFKTSEFTALCELLNINSLEDKEKIFFKR